MRCNINGTLLLKSSCGLKSTHKYETIASAHTGRRGFHSIQENNQHTWSVLKHLYQKQVKSAKKKYACFLLNITDQSFNAFERHKHIWDGADLKVAVDGSANCLARKRMLHTADVLSGDFDSVDPKLLTRIQSPRKAIKMQTSQESGTSETLLQMPIVVETPCQKETDFTKAIRVALSLKPEIQNFFGLYFVDGQRIDHLFGLVNTLHLIKKNIFLVSIQSNTVSWLLQPGTHNILKPLGHELCSLVPFTGPALIKTQGLRYNLNATSPSTFGSMISTSNLCQENRDKIVIETDRELLWSIDMCDKQPNKDTVTG